MGNSKTLVQVSQEKMAVYRATAQRRQAEQQRQLEQRRERAWKLARQAATFLREHFGVSQVVVFGSLARNDRLHLRSDVDLAVWGLDEKLYYRAVGRLLALDASIEVDLVMAEDAPATLRTTIEREGIAV
ncbi:nucleotidyltransferase domain-containing protein [Candidatus Poribacteria bacterium]|nr:nucleotidyltransferase domain-containing protein [Candidatus Poribacteria bacterium]